MPITNKGTVEPYAYITRPDFGTGSFKSARGKYKFAITMSAEDAAPTVKLIDECHKANFAKVCQEFEDNPPAPVKGKKTLQPYERDLPYFENDDGTVTFRFNSWADRQDKKTGETIQMPIKIVDTRGQKIKNVPNIGAGSVIKVSYNMFANGFSAIAGAGVKLQINSVMLVDLVEFGGGTGEWGSELEEDGYVEPKETSKPQEVDDFKDNHEESPEDDDEQF